MLWFIFGILLLLTSFFGFMILWAMHPIWAIIGIGLTIYGLVGIYNVMQGKITKRVCPGCKENVQSREELIDWICENCGSLVPIPRISPDPEKIKKEYEEETE